jgi:glyoxylase I family protein
MAVTGIGGILIRARDPAALNAWYTKCFGVNNTSVNYEPWVQRQGPTVFGFFPADNDYFPSDQQVMLNFRTDDLDALVAQLKADGVKIVKEIETQEGVGRFASVLDPEGNRVELWEPSE